MKDNSKSAMISRLKDHCKVLEKMIREKGWDIPKRNAKCSCIPTKFYSVPAKMRGFAPRPEQGCYTCEQCGRPLYCESCIKNYEMKITQTSMKKLEKFKQNKL